MKHLPLLILMLFATSAFADTGLIFPTRDELPKSETVAFQWDFPSQNGLHWYGPNDEGVTYMWQIKFDQQPQNAYTSTMFYSRGDGQFDAGSGYYMGGTPYPVSGGNVFAISTEGGDFRGTGDDIFSGPPFSVDYGQWYNQAIVVGPGPGSGEHLTKFYIDLPSIADDSYIERLSPSSYGNNSGPLPSEALYFGDAPWATPGGIINWHERCGCTVRGLKIIATALSGTSVLAESQSEDLFTQEAQQNIWYWNQNPTPDAGGIADESGQGNDPHWVTTSRAGLYDTGPVPEPRVAVLLGVGLVGLGVMARRYKQTEG